MRLSVTLQILPTRKKSPNLRKILKNGNSSCTMCKCKNSKIVLASSQWSKTQAFGTSDKIMLNNKIKKFIEDQEFLLVLSHADTGLCLWEDVGGNIWTLDQIIESMKNN